MLDMFTGLTFAMGAALALSILFVLIYEFINGFHDTANAVATVIYTKAMPPHMAVVASGIFNFFGVIAGGLGVAYAILHLLPVDLLLSTSSTYGVVLVFSLLISAILWNLGTWYFGIPSSSSHTLIGSILGIGGAHALMSHIPLTDGINTKKATDIMLSLLISPAIGFFIAALLLWVLKKFWDSRKMHKTPKQRESIDGKKHPPFWTRVTLVVSAMSLSFVHGSNDGQKGIGIIMLVLICMAPAHYALNLDTSHIDIEKTRASAGYIASIYQENNSLLASKINFAPAASDEIKIANDANKSKCSSKQALQHLDQLNSELENLKSYSDLSIDQRKDVRRLLLCIDDTAKKIAKIHDLPSKAKTDLTHLRKDITATTEFAPYWAIFAVALALGLGTMIGWHRVVRTVGEKIGKQEMTYAQGMSAQITAAGAIGIASWTGMPVSTTHVLSSAVAGTMAANKSGLQFNTIRTILITWVLTLPATILISGTIFYCTVQLIS